MPTSCASSSCTAFSRVRAGVLDNWRLYTSSADGVDCSVVYFAPSAPLLSEVARPQEGRRCETATRPVSLSSSFGRTAGSRGRRVDLAKRGGLEPATVDVDCRVGACGCGAIRSVLCVLLACCVDSQSTTGRTERDAALQLDSSGPKSRLRSVWRPLGSMGKRTTRKASS